MRGLRLVLFVAISIFLFHGNGYTQRLEPIDYCKLFTGTKYDQNIILTEAVLFTLPVPDGNIFKSAQYFYSKKCNNRDNFALADFSSLIDVQSFRDAARKHSRKEEHRLFLVSFEGKLSITLQPTFGNLNFLRAKFVIIRVKTVKPIDKKYPLPDMESDAPIIETADSLRLVNSELLSAIFRDKLDTFDFELVRIDDIKMILDGTVVTLKYLTSMLQADAGGELTVRIDRMLQNKNKWQIDGIITKTNMEGSTKKYYFTSKYLIHYKKQALLDFLEIRIVN